MGILKVGTAAMRSSWQALAIEFVEDYDGIELFERNYKTCQ
jgi:hypothetical protein